MLYKHLVPISAKQWDQLLDGRASCGHRRAVGVFITKTCSICLDEFVGHIAEPFKKVALYKKCRHFVHNECSNTWIRERKVCAICRTEVDEIRVYNNIYDILNGCESCDVPLCYNYKNSSTPPITTQVQSQDNRTEAVAYRQNTPRTNNRFRRRQIRIRQQTSLANNISIGATELKHVYSNIHSILNLRGNNVYIQRSLDLIKHNSLINFNVLSALESDANSITRNNSNRFIANLRRNFGTIDCCHKIIQVNSQIIQHQIIINNLYNADIQRVIYQISLNCCIAQQHINIMLLATQFIQ